MNEPPIYVHERFCCWSELICFALYCLAVEEVSVSLFKEDVRLSREHWQVEEHVEILDVNIDLGSCRVRRGRKDYMRHSRA